MSYQNVVVSVQDNPAEVSELGETGSKQWSFVLLSENYGDSIKWNNGLSKNFNQISVGTALNEVSQRLRQPYLKWMAKLGKEINEVAWWASRFSERNTMVSPLFEQVCQMELLRDLTRGLNNNLLIIVKDPLLFRALQDVDWLNPLQNGRFGMKQRRCSINFSSTILFTRQIIFFIGAAIQAKFAGSNLSRIKIRDPILIHTYVDDACLATNGVFRDRYFPGIENYLKSHKNDVLVLPVMVNVSTSLFSAWKWAKNSTTNFVNPFVLYKIQDYFYSLRISFRILRIISRNFVFKNHDLSFLIIQDEIKHGFSLLNFILYLRLPLRLREHGINIKAVLGEFENMIPEKMLILGFRKYQPHAELIGYQHAALYPNLLCLFTPIEEREYAPLYDRIIFNGQMFKDILVREGLNPEIAQIGSALRYQHLWEHALVLEKDIDIFVPLPLVLNAGVELLNKLILACANFNNLRVALKPHPMSTKDNFIHALGDIEIPDNFYFIDKPMNEVLPRARIFVGLSTNTMFEAYVAGIPVIRVGRDSSLNLDPLGYFPDLLPVCFSPEEIRVAIDYIFSLTPSELEEYRKQGAKVRAQAFRAIDEEGLSVFLPSVRHS